MSKLHDDLINEVEPADTPEDSVHALMMGIADRIEGCYGNPVKLSDLCAILREDTAKVGRAVINNTPAMRTNKTSSTGGEAPGTTFQKQRSDVRQGMADNTNDHRDQQYPENGKHPDRAGTHPSRADGARSRPECRGQRAARLSRS
jgi:hypothetical protein